jgi:Ca2+-binding EF-hand superfamily protein
MEARHIAFVFLIAGCSWSTAAATGYAAAQRDSGQTAVRERQMRFREMDRNGDGVITRAEWRGTAQSFREYDTNHDGVLSGDEMWLDRDRRTNPEAAFNRADRNNDGVLTRAEWPDNRDSFDVADINNDGVITLAEYLDDGREGEWRGGDSFSSLDRNGNGVITRSEWTGRPDDFRALDTDGDGVLTEGEYEYRQGRTNTESPAYRAGRERGLTDGRQAGREDRTINGGKWDLDGQRELETADAGYNPVVGSHEDYQAGYRAGFRIGYREGFGPR